MDDLFVLLNPEAKEAAPDAQKQESALMVRTLFNSAFVMHLKRLIGTQSGPGNLPLTIPSLTTLFLVDDRDQADPYTLESLFADLAEFSVLLSEASTTAMIQNMLDNDYLTKDAKGGLWGTERTARVVSTVKRAFPSMPGLNLFAYIEQTIVEALDDRKPIEAALNQFHQTMNMHGRPLVRQQAPTAAPQINREQVQSRAVRPSRNIIKSGPAMPVADLPERAADSQSVLPPEAAPSSVLENEAILSQEVQEKMPDAAALELIPEVSAKPDVVGSPLPEEIPAIQEEMQATPVAVIAETMQENAAVETASSPAVEAGIVEPLPDRKITQKTVIQGREEAQSVKPCPVCARPLIFKEDQYGRFWTCSGFPACRHTEAYQEKSVQEIECPVCRGANVVLKRTPAGKDLFVCPQAGCDFVAWSKPHPVSCPVCRSPYLVEKGDGRGTITLRCPQAGCGYMQPLSGVTASDAESASSAPVKKKVLVRRVGSGSGTGGAVRRVRVVKKQ